MKILLAFVLALASAGTASAQGSNPTGRFVYAATAATAETPHVSFVSEYVRELRTNENNRELAEREIAQEKGDPFPAMIRGSTRIILALRTHIGMLAGMRLKEPFEKLPNNIAEFYGQKIELHDEMSKMATAMMSGPRPGVDYTAMAAEAPKLTAMIEHIDHALFEATPLIFATLIDPKPDRNGHMSRLIVSRSERDQLVRTLETSFGTKMEQKDQNFVVSSASVLRHYLQKKGYKCSDESL